MRALLYKQCTFANLAVTKMVFLPSNWQHNYIKPSNVMWQRSLITDEIWCNFWRFSCVWFKQSCPLDQNYTGATKFSITTINIMTHNIMACSIRTLTIPIKIHDTQHNNTRCWVSISWGSHLYNVCLLYTSPSPRD